MSDLAKAAIVEIILADYVATDAAGKGNLIGAGVALLGFEPAAGVTSKFGAWISIHVPTHLCPVEVPVEIALVDASGELVSMPGPLGEPQPFRVAQIVMIEKPTVPVPVAQRDHIGARSQVVFDFSNGLPLVPGGLYELRVRIDGDDATTRSYPFGVLGAMPPPVIG